MPGRYLLPLVAVMALVVGIALQHILKYDFKTIEGQTYSWTDLSGKWVVVNFFAEWCVPCLKEIPELNDFERASDAKNMHLFAVSYDKLSDSELVALQEKYTMTFSIISSEPKPVLPMALPRQLPATYIISPQGKVLKKLMGEQTNASISSAIAKLESL